MALRPPRILREQAEDLALSVVRTTATAVAAEAVRQAARCFALLPVGAPEAIRSSLVPRLASDEDVGRAVRRACWPLDDPACADAWTTEERCRTWAMEVARQRMRLLAEGWVDLALKERDHRHTHGCDPSTPDRSRSTSARIPATTRTRARRATPPAEAASIRWMTASPATTT